MKNIKTLIALIDTLAPIWMPYVAPKIDELRKKYKV